MPVQATFKSVKLKAGYSSTQITAQCPTFASALEICPQRPQPKQKVPNKSRIPSSANYLSMIANLQI